MKNQSRITFVALIIGLSSLIASVVMAAGIVYHTGMISYGKATLHKGTESFHVNVHMHWNWGHYAGDSKWGRKAWAKPTEAWIWVDHDGPGGLNEPGASEPCGIFDNYDALKVTIYFHNPATGYVSHGFHASVPCNKDTTTAQWVPLHSAGRMRYAKKGVDSYWTAKLEAVYDGPLPNAHGEIDAHYFHRTT